MEDLKAVDVTVLDVRDLTDMTDYMVIATGRSSRQVAALAEHLTLAAKAQKLPPLGVEGLDDAHCVTAWQVLRNEVNPGARVVVADWRADWIGLGLAEHLAVTGSHVSLCVNGAMAGETMQLYARNHYVGRLHKLGVETRTHVRLFGADEDTAYFQDTLTGDAVVLEGTDTLVLALGHVPDDGIATELEDLAGEIHMIGDCVAARTAEEAVYEGMIVGHTI